MFPTEACQKKIDWGGGGGCLEGVPRVPPQLTNAYQTKRNPGLCSSLYSQLSETIQTLSIIFTGTKGKLTSTNSRIWVRFLTVNA